MRVFVFSLFVLFVVLCTYSFLGRDPGAPEPGAVVEVLSPYRYGYVSGYRSFLEQEGMEVPSSRVVMYATDSMDEEYSRGYVDGYHRATEAVHCPRCAY